MRQEVRGGADAADKDSSELRKVRRGRYLAVGLPRWARPFARALPTAVDVRVGRGVA